MILKLDMSKAYDRILSVYKQASGQMINFDKSAACFSLKTDPITKQLISDMLGVRIVACHARYLGLPTVTQRNKYMMFSHVRDTLLQKLSTWNSKLLSTAGKEVLIKAVGQALPTYTKLLSSYVCLFKGRVKPKGDLQEKETGVQWQILKRWEVPWEWQTVSLTSLACGLSFILTGLVETAAVPYLGLRVQDLSIDEKAEILFLDRGITTAAALAVRYTVANTFQPLPQDVYRCVYRRGGLCGQGLLASTDWIFKCQHCLLVGHNWSFGSNS
ncbi:hypothetical protein L3X38_005540 [Prunus dulcis]|uniref:Uncharacterized protein n=1 Tax=Prunus dulcis TaxID=3755 RepID=A0AAD4ZR72_PRUDU|nr:hypothetical protein L3X38_005540 [Prunus dulcis]